MTPLSEPESTRPLPATPPPVELCQVGGECPRHHRWIAVITWAAQIAVVVILAQTLFFKFTYAPETQYIFESRGGRPAATVVGIAELVCVVLLLIPRTAAVGALLSLAVIGGAIFTHLSGLGIEVTNPETGAGDGGFLFGLAVTVALLSGLILFYRRKQLPFVGRLLSKPKPVG